MGTLHEVASVTSKGQVTLQKSIRQLLGVETGDRIAFDVLESQVVVVRRAESASSEPIESLEDEIEGDVAL